MDVIKLSFRNNWQKTKLNLDHCNLKLYFSQIVFKLRASLWQMRNSLNMTIYF